MCVAGNSSRTNDAWLTKISLHPSDLGRVTKEALPGMSDLFSSVLITPD